jgi:methylglyoxal synthase
MTKVASTAAVGHHGGVETQISPVAPAHQPPRRRIALIAHDHRKADLLEWARYNAAPLAVHELLGTGTTGKLISDELGLEVERVESGPLGGDLQIGAMIAQGTIDMLVFFWDPLEPQPHDPDVKALLRVAVVWNIPIACNRATADFLISSPLMTLPYERATHHYGPAMKPQAREAAEAERAAAEAQLLP